MRANDPKLRGPDARRHGRADIEVVSDIPARCAMRFGRPSAWRRAADVNARGCAAGRMLINAATAYTQGCATLVKLVQYASRQILSAKNLVHQHREHARRARRALGLRHDGAQIGRAHV